MREAMGEADLEEKNCKLKRIIIAMKGTAYTGKTTCANAIADYHKCPVIHYDDILDSLSSESSPDSLQEARRLIDVAFNVVCRLVKLQLEMGRPVVVDSPLLRPIDQNRLLNLAGKFRHCNNSECDKLHARCVIVYCLPRDKHLWKMKFEQRDCKETDKWYKPKEWKDIRPRFPDERVKARLERLPGYVSRLIVDTSAWQVLDATELGPATDDLCLRPVEESYIDFQTWLRSKTRPNRPPPEQLGDDNSQQLKINTEIRTVLCDTVGHHLLGEVTKFFFDLGRCRACQNVISYGQLAYACKRCNLALHMSCFNSDQDQDGAVILPPHQPPPFLRRDRHGQVVLLSDDSNNIPQEYRQSCSLCQVDGKEFSTKCERCLWEVHLRSHLVPTFLCKSGKPDHATSFWITSTKDVHDHICHACLHRGAIAGYTCKEHLYEFNIHVKCLHLPRTLRHVHGRREHHMHLAFGDEEKEEEYLCDVCLDSMNPNAWYYYCQECDFASHIHCVCAS